ncbi:hypothetical protein [Corynebacterium sp. 335C]
MIVLVDGRSGAGKTTLARRWSAALGWPVVHLEDVYPGWGGLAAAADAVATRLLDPATASYRRWDWYAMAPAEEVPVPLDRSLVIEGCGALTADNLAAAGRLGDVAGVWVELGADERRARAMARDEHFAGHWDMWAAQEAEHIARHSPRDLADWVIAGSRR